jgi:hypothetical protein
MTRNQVSTSVPLPDPKGAEDVRRIVHDEFLHWFDGEETAVQNAHTLPSLKIQPNTRAIPSLAWAIQ